MIQERRATIPRISSRMMIPDRTRTILAVETGGRARLDPLAKYPNQNRSSPTLATKQLVAGHLIHIQKTHRLHQGPKKSRLYMSLKRAEMMN